MIVTIHGISKNEKPFSSFWVFLFKYVMMFALSTINAFILLIFFHSLFYLLVNITREKKCFFVWTSKRRRIDIARWCPPAFSFSININKLCNCLFYRKRNDSDNFSPTYPICIISSETQNTNIKHIFIDTRSAFYSP